MSINSSNQSFRAIPHPSIYNVRSYVLHTGRRKGMAQVILRYFFILHHSLENAIQSIKKHSKDFGGTLDDPDVMKLCGCSRNSYYKYKREIKYPKNILNG